MITVSLPYHPFLSYHWGSSRREKSCLYSSVAQWQSIRLLTGGLLVRVQPEEPTAIKSIASTDEVALAEHPASDNSAGARELQCAQPIAEKEQRCSSGTVNNLQTRALA